MKTNPSGSQRQRYKAAMIPVLGMVLVAVVLWPAADEPTPAASAARGTAATRVWSPEHGHYHDANGVQVP